MQAERHSWSKETPQNFQHLREVVGNYFHNATHFVIFHLDPSNYLTISKQSSQKNRPGEALTTLWEILQWEKILENEVQENKRGNRKWNLYKYSKKNEFEVIF